jgi:hypothetical protein
MSNETPVTPSALQDLVNARVDPPDLCTLDLPALLRDQRPRGLTFGERNSLAIILRERLRASAAKGWPEDALILRHSLDHNNGTATHVMIERELVARLMNMLRAAPGEAKCGTCDGDRAIELKTHDSERYTKDCPDCAPGEAKS